MGFIVRSGFRRRAFQTCFRATHASHLHSRYGARTERDLELFDVVPHRPPPDLAYLTHPFPSQTFLGRGPTGANERDAGSDRTSRNPTGTRYSASESGGWASRSRGSAGKSEHPPSSVFSLPRSHVSNKGGMFGQRGGVTGADTTHALRRPFAGAETREELEQLEDDVLRVIVDEAREKIAKDERRARAAERDRLAELEEVAVDGNSDDEHGSKRAGPPKPDPVAETVLHMGDGDDDVLDAIRGLGEKQRVTGILQRGDLARAILATRLARRAGARKRRCVCISRSFHGDGTAAMAKIIHPEDFERFIHRGVDCEGCDAKEIARLYACCLAGRAGGRAAAADALDANQLCLVLESGRWKRSWSKYVKDARRRALDRGACGAALGACWAFHQIRSLPVCPYSYQKGLLPLDCLSRLFVHTSRYTRLTLFFTIAAVFGATSKDPFADFASDAKLAKQRNHTAGYPDPGFLGAFASLANVSRYVGLCAACVTLPVFGCVARPRGPFKTVAAVSSAAKFALPGFLRKNDSSFLSRMGPVFVAGAFWSLAVVSLFLYALKRPEHTLVDVLVPAGWSFFLVSLVASGISASLTYGASDPNCFRDPTKWKPSHAFPGGRTVVPDDTVGVAQDDGHETRGGAGGEFLGARHATHKNQMTALTTKRNSQFWSDAHVEAGNGAFESAGDDTGKVNDPDTGGKDGVSRKTGGFGSFAKTALLGAREGLHENDENAAPNLPKEEAEALCDSKNAHVPVGFDGSSRPDRVPGARGKRGLASAGRGNGHDQRLAGRGGGAQKNSQEFENRREEGAHGARPTESKAPKTPFVSTTEKDIADAVTRRAVEELSALSARGGFLGGYLGSRALHWSHKFVFLVAAVLVAATPAAHRLGTGVAVFGGADSVFVCVDSVLPASVSGVLGLAKCASLQSNTTEAVEDVSTADYSPSLTDAMDAISVATQAGDANSATGAAVVSASALWCAVGVYLVLTSTRWITSLAHAHYVRLRIFAQVTDRSAAAAADVPFLNLRKASLPWLRLRVHFHRHRALEMKWASLLTMHLLVATLLCAFAAAVCATRQYTSPHATQTPNARAVVFAVCALSFSVPLVVLAQINSAIKQTVNDDETVVAREIWKMALDAEELDLFGASQGPGGGFVGDQQSIGRTQQSMSRTAQTFVRENNRLRALLGELQASSKESGSGASLASAYATLSLFASVSLLVSVVALVLLDVTETQPYQGMTVDKLSVNVEANFAVAHAAHVFLAKRLTKLAANVTEVMALVTQTSGLVAVVDNNSARQALEAVNSLTESLEGGGCVS